MDRNVEVSLGTPGFPSGIAEIRNDGRVLFLSDSFCELFNTCRPDEIPVYLEDHFGSSLDSIGAALKGLSPRAGAVLCFGFDCPVEKASAKTSRSRHLVCTLTRTTTESVIISVSDFTEMAGLREQLDSVALALHFRESWLEVTKGLLHDIGNAISGMSLLATQMNSEEEWEEFDCLSSLQSYVRAHQSELENALGAADYDALTRMLNVLKSTWENRKSSLGENLNMMMHSVVHVGELIYLHRTYSVGPEDDEREPLDLKRVIMDSLLILHSQLEKRKVRIKIEEDAPTFLIRGNRARLLSVFLNIVKNAYESLDLRGGEVGDKIITIVLSCPKPEVVYVQVTDNGSGFAPEHGERLFEKNFSTKKRLSGLGLYSCRNVVTDHGGKIWMVSDGIGRGASVFIEFPPLRLAT